MNLRLRPAEDGDKGVHPVGRPFVEVLRGQRRGKLGGRRGYESWIVVVWLDRRCRRRWLGLSVAEQRVHARGTESGDCDTRGYEEGCGRELFER